jgi:hypothetical protein
LVNSNSSPLAGGDHTVDAVFTPTDPDYATSDGSSSLTVDPASTHTSLTVRSSHIIAHVTTTSVATLYLAGDVDFEVDGKSVGHAAIENGTAVLAHTVPSNKTHHVVASFPGSADFAASGASTARRNPKVTATATSRIPKSSYGWYRTPVTVSFTCKPTGTLVSRCPKPVTLTRSASGQSVSRTVRQTNGGQATVTLGPINIDRIKPHVAAAGVRDGGTYDRKQHVRCVAHDALSGIASCSVTQTTHAHITRYRVVATDRAGNTATVRGRYRS